MPRTNLLCSFTLALACFVGTHAVGAQEATTNASIPVVTTDPASQVRTLPAMRVTAEKPKASREGVLALMEENMRLGAELRRQDQQVERLTKRLAYIKGPVTDSLNRDITRLDSQTAETRARRQALEARLVALEGTQSAAVAP